MGKLNGRRRILALLAAAVLAVCGVGAALAVGETTGTVVACAHATVGAQTIDVNGTPIATVPSQTSDQCVTSTYTIPTVTVTTGTTTAPTTTTTPTVTPSIPTGFNAAAGDSSATMTWAANPPKDQVDAYQVYVNGKSYDLNVTSTSYTLTGLTDGTSYSLRISAHNAAGYGDWTAAITVTPHAATTTTSSSAASFVGDTPSDFAGWEFAGVNKTSPTLAQRVTYTAGGAVGSAPGVLHVSTDSGDQYFSTTGWRTLGRENDPSCCTFTAGHKGWWVWAERAPTSYPDDANVWVSPFEMHQTKASYVSVTGPAMLDFITKPAGVTLQLRGGRDGSATTYVNTTYPGSYTPGVWNVYVLGDDLETAATGSVELLHCTSGTPLSQVMSRSGISTLYEGTTGYVEFGIYRAQSGTSTTSMDFAGFREYPDRAAATGWAESLCG